MKLTGNLKNKVDKAAELSEKRSLIEKAGMMLTDDELVMVAGGVDYRRGGGENNSPSHGRFNDPFNEPESVSVELLCKNCQNIWTERLINGLIPMCPNCGPNGDVTCVTQPNISPIV